MQVFVEKSQMYYLSKYDFIKNKQHYLKVKTFYFEEFSIFKKKQFVFFKIINLQIKYIQI